MSENTNGQLVPWRQWLTDLAAPPLVVCVAEPDETAHWNLPDGYSVRRASGTRATEHGLFPELQNVLEFPPGTGTTWSGLDDWMRDLSWLDPAVGFLLIVRDAENLLKDLAGFDFVNQIDYWAHSWATESRWYVPGRADNPTDFFLTLPKPFRVLLQTTSHDAVTSQLQHIEARWAIVLHPLEEGENAPPLVAFPPLAEEAPYRPLLRHGQIPGLREEP